jgi:hypothetical protein
MEATRCNHQIKPAHDTVYTGRAFITAGNSKRTARAEIVLHIYNQKTALFKQDFLNST